MLLNVLLICLIQFMFTGAVPSINTNNSTNVLQFNDKKAPAPQHQSSSKTTINPLDATTYNGDVLNVTKCYCQDPYDTLRKGYYYQYYYYNWHGNRFYQTHRTCDSRHHNHHDGMKWIPKCWGDDGFKEEAMNYTSCDIQYSPDHHKLQGKFCVQLQGIRIANVNWTTWDFYVFGIQWRSVQNMRSWYDLDANVCREHCEQKLPGMVIAEDREGSLAMTVKGPDDTFVLENRYTSYTDLDDMCDGCK